MAVLPAVDRLDHHSLLGLRDDGHDRFRLAHHPVGNVLGTVWLEDLQQARLEKENLMNIPAFLFIGIAAVVLVVILVALDLTFVGGACTMGVMQGTAMMASNPIGQGILLVMLAMFSVLVYVLFFR